MTENDTTSGDDPDSDGTEAPERIDIRFKAADGTWRRVRFAPRADGPGWWRCEEEWTGCHWRPVGREVVTDLRLDVGD